MMLPVNGTRLSMSTSIRVKRETREQLETGEDKPKSGSTLFLFFFPPSTSHTQINPSRLTDDGWISVNSVPGRTVFRISLPRAPKNIKES